MLCRSLLGYLDRKLDLIATCISLSCFAIAISLLGAAFFIKRKLAYTFGAAAGEARSNGSTDSISQRDRDLRSLITTPRTRVRSAKRAREQSSRSQRQHRQKADASQQAPTPPPASVAQHASPSFSHTPAVHPTPSGAQWQQQQAATTPLSAASSLSFRTAASELVEMSTSLRTAADIDRFMLASWYASPARSSSDGSSETQRQAVQDIGTPQHTPVFSGDQQQQRYLQQLQQAEYKTSPPAESKKSPKDKHREIYMATSRSVNDIFVALKPNSSRVELIDKTREWLSGMLKQTHSKLRVSTALASDGCSRAMGRQVALTSLVEPEQINFEEEQSVLEQAASQFEQMDARMSNNNSALFARYIRRHERMLAVIRGTAKHGLITTTPPGYVVKRMRELADGTCLEHFQWDAGSEYDGKRWNKEQLPDDSLLVMHLLACFLENHGWADESTVMGNISSTGAGSSDPLYVGSLPSRLPKRYFAILPSLPHLVQGECTLLVVPRTKPSQFQLVLDGSEMLHLSDRMGLLDAVSLFLLHADRRAGGSLGALRLRSSPIGLETLLDS